jgi:hypothetical protein
LAVPLTPTFDREITFRFGLRDHGSRRQSLQPWKNRLHPIRLYTSRFAKLEASIPGEANLADSTQTVHTRGMTLKTAAFLRLVGTILLTVLVTADFIKVFTGVLRDVVPAMALLRSLVYLLASFMVTVLFYVFHRQA